MNEEINRGDRKKLVDLCKLFGDYYHSDKMQMTVGAWRKRFWFDTKDGVEFIESIEILKGDLSSQEA